MQQTNRLTAATGLVDTSDAAPTQTSANQDTNLAAWQTVRKSLQKEFGDAAYRHWLNPMTFVGIEGAVATMALPTRFLRDWIESNYRSRLKVIWHTQDARVRDINLIVADHPLMADEQNSSPMSPKEEVWANDEKDEAQKNAEASAIIGSPLDARLTFENFIVGKPNEFAFAAAKRIAETEEVSFNPLFLHGGVGLGKTHLMHAIAWDIQRRFPKRKVVYLSAEKFMYQFIKALRFKDTMSFKEQFRSVDVLMIDDFQFISGKDATQEEFFHTFNALVDQNKQIIISADKAPSELDGLEERLRSRLGWGLVADIHPATYELRLGILQAKAEQKKIKVEREVLEFMAHKITANVRELEGALNRLSAHVTLVGGEITIETAQDLLADMLRAANRRQTVEEIQKKVAEHFNIKQAEMHSPRRSRAVARPRQIAMYLAKVLTTASLPEIGRKFGGRDHTTVIHAIRKVEELLEIDTQLSEDVHVLKRSLQS